MPGGSSYFRFIRIGTIGAVIITVNIGGISRSVVHFWPQYKVALCK